MTLLADIGWFGLLLRAGLIVGTIVFIWRAISHVEGVKLLDDEDHYYDHY